MIIYLCNSINYYPSVRNVPVGVFFFLLTYAVHLNEKNITTNQITCNYYIFRYLRFENKQNVSVLIPFNAYSF